MKIRGIIGGLISSVSAGDFSFLLSDYSSSQAETSLAKSEDSEIVVPNVSSELSRLFPFVRNRLPFLIVLAVRLKKLLKVNKLFADFVKSPFGKVCISKIDQFIDGADDLDKKIFIASAVTPLLEFVLRCMLIILTIFISIVIASKGQIQSSFDKNFSNPEPNLSKSSSRGSTQDSVASLAPSSTASAPDISQENSSTGESKAPDSVRESFRSPSSSGEEQATELSQDLNQLIPSIGENKVPMSVQDPSLTEEDKQLSPNDLPGLRSPFAISGYLIDSFVESLNIKCSSCLVRIFPSAPPQILSYLASETASTIVVDSIDLSSANDDVIVVEASLRNLDSAKSKDLIFSIDPSSGKIIDLKPLSIFAGGF